MGEDDEEEVCEDNDAAVDALVNNVKALGAPAIAQMTGSSEGAVNALLAAFANSAAGNTCATVAGIEQQMPGGFCGLDFGNVNMENPCAETCGECSEEEDEEEDTKDGDDDEDDDQDDDDEDDDEVSGSSYCGEGTEWNDATGKCECSCASQDDPCSGATEEDCNGQCSWDDGECSVDACKKMQLMGEFIRHFKPKYCQK